MTTLITATRFWATSEEQLRTLDSWVERALTYSDYVLVAVRIETDCCDTIDHLNDKEIDKLRAIPVYPWNGFTAAMNALLYVAASVGDMRNEYKEPYQTFQNITAGDPGRYILFQSIEIEASSVYVREGMLKYITENEDVLVIGSSLAECHEFEAGEQQLTGLTAPWNTNAMWHLQSLAKTGFLTVSDGIAGPSGPAMEEVVAVSVQQLIAANSDKNARYKAVLTAPTPEVVWNLNFGDDKERIKAHKAKMASKKERSQAQCALLGISMGTVQHISIEI